MSVRGPLIKLAVFAVVAIMATTLIWTTLQNTVSGETYGYSAEFTDVSGLKVGDDVRIAGVKVGRIEDMELVDTRAEVSFSVQRDQPIFENTRALIRYQNLVGQRYLALLPGAGQAKPLTDGARIPPERTEPSLDLTALLNGFEPLFAMLEPADVNRLSENIVRVLQGEGPALTSLLTQSSQLTSAIASRDDVIGQVITNLTGVLDHLSGKGDQLQQLVGQTKKLVDGLAANADPIFGAVERIDKVSGAITGLIGDIRPALKDDIGKFNQVAALFLKEGPTVEATLQGLPGFLAGLARISHYGSWWNLYACAIDINLAPLPSGILPKLGGDKHTEVCR
ncbi:phospholipid/cholesterol/gamma-HCH transport system substrate-binding protein [Amycolatopsis xylanica]|uniref:Phospholipid/cholesterol/gamma-HCH transport system substrate-binding protein n=1 Tax=Amycolatopsis xylanica TaxID=589385 RepID=A0A1H3SQP0_9PSEU|nr:MCE family protein [Amycolatopsis xylanica]SDZ40272.1 phospholipid/cholesterol/gamma-HCH transport system substrate-binding protein [Amycolatopsis xylanica]